LRNLYSGCASGPFTSILSYLSHRRYGETRYGIQQRGDEGNCGQSYARRGGVGRRGASPARPCGVGWEEALGWMAALTRALMPGIESRGRGGAGPPDGRRWARRAAHVRSEVKGRANSPGPPVPSPDLPHCGQAQVPSNRLTAPARIPLPPPQPTSPDPTRPGGDQDPYPPPLPSPLRLTRQTRLRTSSRPTPAPPGWCRGPDSQTAGCGRGGVERGSWVSARSRHPRMGPQGWTAPNGAVCGVRGVGRMGGGVTGCSVGVLAGQGYGVRGGHPCQHQGRR
jgi:hypothetical protein